MEPPEIQEAFERVREALRTADLVKGTPAADIIDLGFSASSRLEAAFATQQTALDLMAKDLLAAWEVSQRRDY